MKAEDRIKELEEKIHQLETENETLKTPLHLFVIDKLEKLNNDWIDSTIVSYQNLGSKYAILKPSVIVEVAMKEGLVVKIDVTKYFKNLL
jgi:hypothetical protein